MAIMEVEAHASMCQCFTLHGDMQSVLSGGADGRVLQWTIEDADPFLSKPLVCRP